MLVVSLCLAAGGAARAEPALTAPLLADARLTKGVLPNGLTYFIQQNAKPTKMVELRLVVKAGSILEDDDQQGLAHLIEHMAFGGSAHFKGDSLRSYLESIGVRFGADLNAFTSFENTLYILPIPTDKEGNLEQGFTVLADWAGGLTLDDAAFEHERTIVLEEMRLKRSPDENIHDAVRRKSYLGSRLPLRQPIGKEAVLKSFTPDAARRFYRDWYRPDLMAVVVVGDIAPDAARRLVESHFSQLVNPANPRTPVYTELPRRTTDDSFVNTNQANVANALQLYYRPYQPTPVTLLADFRERLMERLFAIMLGERVRELTLQADPPFIRASVGLNDMQPRFKQYSASVVAGPAGPLPALEALVGMNEAVRQQGFSAAELARAGKSLLGLLERGYDERDKTDSRRYADGYVRSFLSGDTVSGIENDVATARTMLPALTLAEMNAFARRTVPSNEPKLLVYIGAPPAGTAPVTSASLLDTVRKAEQAPVRAHDEGTLASRLMAKLPAAGGIVDEQVNALLGTHTLTLSNGIKVILKPTDFSNGRVVLSVSRYGGMSTLDAADAQNARYAVAAVQATGVNGMAPLEVQRVLAGSSANLSAYLDQYNEGYWGSAANADLETLLQLTHLSMTSVRRDESLYKSLIANLSENARLNSATPQAALDKAFNVALFGANPWAFGPPQPQDFLQLSLDRALAIYRARFFSAKGFTFVLVGSFDLDKVKPLLATYLASLPVTDLALGYRDLGLNPARGVVKKEVRSGTIDRSFVRLNFSGVAPVSDDAALRFQALLEVMNLRVTDGLRQKLGLVYAGGFSGGVNSVPSERYSITATVPTAEANSEKVVAALFDEIRHMQASGPSAQDLDKVKQSFLQLRRTQSRENFFWAAQLQNSAQRQTDPARILAYERRVAAITVDEVREAARRYFDLNNYVQVTLYPKSAVSTALGL